MAPEPAHFHCRHIRRRGFPYSRAVGLVKQEADMRPTLLALPLAILTIVGLSPGTAAAQESKKAPGKVTAVTATSLTISGSSGGGATFTQTFVIDPTTKVVGKGAGTAAAKSGGKIAVTEVVHSGDTVNVSFNEMTGALHAK